MNKTSTKFLKGVLVLIGIIVAGLMLWEPHLEGRNVNADFFAIYFHDPFLAYIYIGAIPFFIALYQAFKLLTYIEKNKTFTDAAVAALKNIKYCAMAIIAFMAGALAIIRILAFRGEDDPAGAMAIGIVVIFAATVIGTFAAVLQKLFQSAIDIKTENDLTV
jgi:hypothetical protein